MLETLLQLGSIASLILKWLPTFIKLGPDVVKLIDAGKPVLDAITEVAPVALPIIRQIAAKVFPASLESHEASQEARVIVSKAIFAPHTMTPDEEKAWFDRTSGRADGP